LAASFFLEMKLCKNRAKQKAETFQNHREFDAP